MTDVCIDMRIGVCIDMCIDMFRDSMGTADRLV